MKHSLKENYIRFFGNLTEHDGMGRKKGYLRESSENIKPGSVIDFVGNDSYGISQGKYKILKVYEFEGDLAYDIENIETKEKHTHVNPDLLHGKGYWAK